MFHVLKLCYDDSYISQTLKETITNSAVETLMDRGIDCYQLSASRIAFMSERDRTLASLILTPRASFTVLYE